jgi:predicted nucleic acid-binding Zn ribbon protein
VLEIGKVLPAVFKGHMRRVNPPLVEILAPLWPCVAGKSIAERSEPIAFEAGVLTLAAQSASWAAQLGSMAEEIRAQVNAFLGAPLVKKLRVRLSAGVNPTFGRLGSALHP